MDAQQQLFGLMAVAEDQQKAVQAAIDGLAAERVALAKERAAVAQAGASVAGIAGDVRKAAIEAVKVMQEAAGEAVSQSLAGASSTAAKAIEEASTPVIGRLSSVVQAAREAEGSMRNAGEWFAWKWAALAAGGLVGVCLVAYASLAWQLHQASSLREEVALLQAQAEDWAKRGGRAKLETCGDAKRLCARIDKSAGYGKDGDYFVLRGY